MADLETVTGWRRWTPWLALGGLVLSVLAGVLVPIYTDEIGWRFQERAGIDGGLDIMFTDACGPNTIARAPWFMMPVRWFSATTNQAFADPIFVRGEGVACALAWIALFWVLIDRLEGDDAKRARVRTLTLSLLGLGLLPYVMVLSRPEQPIILAMTLALLLTFARLPSMSPALSAWIKAIGLVLLSTVMLSYHLKGLLYVGVAAGCLLVSIGGRRTLTPRLAGIVVMGALSVAAAKYWRGRFGCPGDPTLASLLNEQNIASVLANGGRISTLLTHMIVGANPLNYVSLVVPRGDPMSAWMPPDLFSLPLTTFFLIGMFLAWGGALVLALDALRAFMAAARWRALGEPRVLAALGFLGLVLVWGASQLTKNLYEGAHILPSLAVLVTLCLTLPGSETSLARHLPKQTLLTLSLALCSQLIVLGLTVAPMADAARSPGYIPGQPYSNAAGGYPAIRRDIAAVRAASGMPTDRRLERPLIDDLTYLALQDSHLPLHRLGVLQVGNGFSWKGSITDPVSFLKSRNSDGVIVGCHLLPPAMRLAAVRSGAICAISRTGLEALAAERGD